MYQNIYKSLWINVSGKFINASESLNVMKPDKYD